MPCMYIIDKPTKWEDYLHLLEFTYNNSCQKSLEMTPLEFLYGRKCNNLVSWDNLVDRIILGLEMLKELEQIV